MLFTFFSSENNAYISNQATFSFKDYFKKIYFIIFDAWTLSSCSKQGLFFLAEHGF